MNKQEYETAVEHVMWFNSLAFDAATRNSTEYLSKCIELCEEELEEFKETYNDKDTLKEAADCFYALIQTIRCPNISIEDMAKYTMHLGWVMGMCEGLQLILPRAIDCVAASNLTKIPLLAEVKEMYGEEWQEASCSWIADQGRYEGIYGTVVVDPEGKERVVFKEKGGKVVKPWCYKEANLEWVL